MRRTNPTVACALSQAVDTARALYNQIPEARRPDITGESFQALEREIDARCGAGDEEGALLAIERWQDHALRVLGNAQAAMPARQ